MTPPGGQATPALLWHLEVHSLFYFTCHALMNFIILEDAAPMSQSEHPSLNCLLFTYLAGTSFTPFVLSHGLPGPEGANYLKGNNHGLLHPHILQVSLSINSEGAASTQRSPKAMLGLSGLKALFGLWPSGLDPLTLPVPLSSGLLNQKFAPGP